MRYITIIFILFLSISTNAQQDDYSLDGEWKFATDPVKVGEQSGWYNADFNSSSFDNVTVPHCFSVDPRYMFYTGKAWYFKKFTSVASSQKRTYLKFDAVFYKCKVWLNGTMVGEHEGGYTPFEFDITAAQKDSNVLTIEVDNTWDTTTIPGAKASDNYEKPNAAQWFPWINYGGITRPVHLITRPEVYVQNIKVVTEPDLAKGNAVISIKAFIKNTSSSAQKVPIKLLIKHDDKTPDIVFKPVDISIGAGETAITDITGTLAAKDVKLWNQDAPNLYTAQVSTNSDTLDKRFGIRKIEVKGTQLLLNGEPIKMGGCNRPLDYPGYGSMDPKEVLDKDLTLIKSGGMELSRINHYPVTEYQLDWADEHGLLIIEEAGNWQMTPKQMSDTMMRRKFQSQMKEMIERDWNHPCLIAYSVGNEFRSQTEAGRAWVRDMKQFVRSLDSSRLITFASMYVARPTISSPEEEASQYCDFVSANIYGDHFNALERIHKLYPDKPVYISEFGWRTDGVKSEAERVALLKKAMQDFRKCDYLIGASVWTFNDYFSRFPGTNANGYRPWGLVEPDRQPRGIYPAWQEEFAPATVELIKTGSGNAIKVTARHDFPAYTLRNYQLQCNGKTYNIKTLKPGEEEMIDVSIPSQQANVQLIKPGGFVILQKILQ
ncbi:glycoside hydrolase family 2 protein [Parafilimonas sp.]|uniref:glycoside hydrolase family 2 protein n=1 Tax=Parafilimonas sp. TaxID=1969739 RepID=UPI003F807BE2